MAVLLPPWLVETGDGTPAPSATPAWLFYGLRDGTALAQPTILNLGGGLFSFWIPDADLARGVVYLIDNDVGGALQLMPRRTYGAQFVPGAPFGCIELEDNQGALWSGAAPTLPVYEDASLNARTPPAITSPTTGLYVFTPSASDLTTGVAYRLDAPAGAYPLQYSGGFGWPYPVAGAAATSDGLGYEDIAVQAIREHLLMFLPAKVAELNTLRPAVLKSAYVEPFTFPAATSLKLGINRDGSSPTTCAMTAGTRTAAQVAFDINSASPPGLVATFDRDGRVILTASAKPAQDAPSVVCALADTTGANLILGWSPGGETVLYSALVAPTNAGVMDGWPMASPETGQAFWLILDERQSVQIEPLRRYEYLVTIPILCFKPELGMGTHRSREGVSMVVRAVREVLHTLRGRYAGHEGFGDVMLVQVTNVFIPGKAFSFKGENVLYDTASLTITARVFARPAGA